MFKNKEALLLDMNSTFMFGEDRFGEEEDYSEYYRTIGGGLSADHVNDIINHVYEYLGYRYPTEGYRHCFPTLEEAIESGVNIEISNHEKEKIIETFAFHEHGAIPEEYVSALKQLHEKFTLSLVVDIWAPKDMWLTTFRNLGIWELFTAYSFSSDHGMVKPSPKPFEIVINKLNIPKEKCLVIGDSLRRDLGGSLAAGIDCVLVGGATSGRAFASYSSLLQFNEDVQSCN